MFQRKRKKYVCLFICSISFINAFIDIRNLQVVFMSSLFYVLSASGSVYKPVAVLGNLAPGQMNQYGFLSCSFT